LENNSTGFDAYKPSQIAEIVEAVGVTKARLPVLQLLTLAVLAGVFIGIGAAAYTMVMTGVDASFGPARFLGGIVFSLGLILVIVGGAELFTGNALMIMAAVDGLIKPGELLKNWTIVYAGNFFGATGLAIVFYSTGILDGAAGSTAIAIAEAKSELSWFEAFMRGVLCNMLVCLAVWLAIAARTVAGKILAIIWPIASFVLLGLEHSIANMYLMPQGMLSGANVSIPDMVFGLIFVTLGNIIGGAGGVALSYHLAYKPNFVS
jgi:formate/nitrite transporter